MESLSGTATSSTINIGTLVLYDPAAKQLVWIGAASKTVDPGKNRRRIARTWIRQRKNC
jgi:hypothetical protein